MSSEKRPSLAWAMGRRRHPAGCRGPRHRRFRPDLADPELEPRRLLSAYIVTDSSDLPLDSQNGPGETSSHTITLRSAIQQVDIDGGGSIGFLSAMTITTSGLPAITAPGVTIDGGTLGSIEVDGAQGNSASGLILEGGGAVIKNLEITGFGIDGIDIYSARNTIGGTTASGNAIAGNGTTATGSPYRVNLGIMFAQSYGNLVEGDFIGTNAAGAAGLDAPYTLGAFIGYGATNNTIGGTAVGAGNVISGNSAVGVQLLGAGTTGNVVEGNVIGANAAGSAALANKADGIDVDAPGNTIGGTVAAACNVISGNRYTGIALFSDGGSTLVEGNRIGTNAAGNSSIANGAEGIYVSGSADTIGGTTAGAGNAISGNGNRGIFIDGSGATNNLVLGNLLGTTADGKAALGNGLQGVYIDSGASANTIGGTTAAAANEIAGNGTDATSSWYYSNLELEFAGTTGNVIEGDYIGTNSAGTAGLDAPYTYGLFIGNGAAGNLIGGTAAGAGNVISGNTVDGLYIYGTETTGELVQGNFIGTNPAGTVALPKAASGNNLNVYFLGSIV